MTVNNYPVSQKEYDLFLNKNIANTYSIFSHRTKNDPDTDFWNTAYEGITPLEYLKKIAKEDLVRAKVIQELALQKGIIQVFNFGELMENWKEMKRSNELKIEEGEIVYGVANMDFPNYYNYLWTNLEIELQDYFFKNEIKIDKQSLLKYYEKIKEDHFIYIDEVSMECLCFDYSASVERNQRLKQVEKAKRYLDQGATMVELESRFPSSTYQKKYFTDSIALYGEENMDRDLKKYATQLTYGTYDIMDNNYLLNGTICILSLVEQIEKQIIPFSEAQKELIYLYKAQEFENIIKKKVENAEVKMSNNTYYEIQYLP